MRPVNLIPLDERRGSARTGGGRQAPIRVYLVLGVLGVVLLSVLALVLTNNQINGKTEDLSKVRAEEQGVKQAADALRPYGQFAQVQQSRRAQISQLASSRFNWERGLRQLSRAIPSNVWLLTLSATVSPTVEVEAAGGGGGASALREKVNAPAFTISGCTYSQHAVARMMTRMQNLDDVTDVQLAKSARKDESSSSGTAAAQASASSGTQQVEEDPTDCTGSTRVTQFEMLIVFGGSPLALAGGTAQAGATPNSTAQNAATAQSAVTTANGASSAAGGTGGTP
jgi:Tfp pilus assembly protein PilN